MLGAIIGDLAGSRFEWNTIKTKDFDLLNYKCSLTDSGILTIALAQAILNANDESVLPQAVSASFQEFAHLYPKVGYRQTFARWLSDAVHAPVISPGNDVASWISPVAFTAGSLEEVRSLAASVSSVTHCHPQAQKGAEAVAVAIYLAQSGSSIPEIRSAMKSYYALDFELDQIRGSYSSDGTCLSSVPQAIAAFLESDCFENAVRNAVSLGSDSAVIASIAGSIAEAYYGIPSDLRNRVITFLDSRQHTVIHAFERRYGAIYEKNSVSAPVSSIRILAEAALAGGIDVIETERPVSILSAVFTEPDIAMERQNRPVKKPVKRKTKAGKRPKKTEAKSKKTDS